MPDFVTLSLVAALCFAVGGVMQKHGIATRLPGLHYRQVFSRFGEFSAAMWMNRLWLLGFVIVLAGSPFSIQAMAIGDVTVVKPLMRIQILFVVLIGVGVLGERLTRREWLGTLLLCAGALALAVEGRGSTSGVPDTLGSGLLFVLTLTLCGALLWVHHLRPERVRQEMALGLAGGLLLGAGDVLMKSATGTVSTALGSFDITQAACLSALLAAPETYLSVVSDVTCFFLMQAAYSRGRVSVVIPIASIGAVVFTVLVGHLFLHEIMPGTRVAATTAIAGGALLFASREAPRLDRGSSTPSDRIEAAEGDGSQA